MTRAASILNLAESIGRNQAVRRAAHHAGSDPYKHHPAWSRHLRQYGHIYSAAAALAVAPALYHHFGFPTHR